MKIDADVMLTTMLIAVIGMLISLGWIWAHATVATECTRLGAFYVGEKVYECRLKQGGAA